MGMLRGTRKAVPPMKHNPETDKPKNIMAFNNVTKSGIPVLRQERRGSRQINSATNKAAVDTNM
jgi:hypothetical protein